MQEEKSTKKSNTDIITKDISKGTFNGFLGLLIHSLLGVWIIFIFIAIPEIGWLFNILIFGPIWTIYCNSYIIINPNQGAALLFFGKYSGTIKEEGFRFFLNPFYEKRKISLRIRNFESSQIKVNDVNANPILIGAIVVWRVYDVAEALFEVDDFEEYVQIQSEAALRAMATKYPYDIIEEKDKGGIALSSHQEVVATELQASVEDRLERAGIEVLEARISHLAYSQEIAQAMLRRQQASAVVAARREIVDGAVGMVELALDQLSSKNIINLNEEMKATMVSNLLVVLCSETDTTPVVNTGLN